MDDSKIVIVKKKHQKELGSNANSFGDSSLNLFESFNFAESKCFTLSKLKLSLDFPWIED